MSTEYLPPQRQLSQLYQILYLLCEKTHLMASKQAALK